MWASATGEHIFVFPFAGKVKHFSKGYNILPKSCQKLRTGYFSRISALETWGKLGLGKVWAVIWGIESDVLPRSAQLHFPQGRPGSGMSREPCCDLSLTQYLQNPVICHSHAWSRLSHIGRQCFWFSRRVTVNTFWPECLRVLILLKWPSEEALGYVAMGANQVNQKSRRIPCHLWSLFTHLWNGPGPWVIDKDQLTEVVMAREWH